MLKGLPDSWQQKAGINFYENRQTLTTNLLGIHVGVHTLQHLPDNHITRTDAMNDRRKIIDKLKKMQAKAASSEALGYEAEALAFAEAMQKMISEYKVEKAELGVEDEKKEEIKLVRAPLEKFKIPLRRRQSPWQQRLAAAIAAGHYCRVAISLGSNAIWFAGKEVDAQIAGDVWGKLVVAAEAIADKEYVAYFYRCKRDGKVHLARGYRQSFLLGFTNRLRQRYAEHMEELRKYYASNKLALATLAESSSMIDDWIDKNVKPGKGVDPPYIQNREGYFQGERRGSEINLSGKEIA